MGDDKVVFITGATKDTGFAIASRFAREGWNVCVSSREELHALEAAHKLMQSYPAIKASGYALDLLDVKDIKRVFARIASEYGRLDSFVANAAHLGLGLNILNTTQEQYDEVMQTNARGCFFCCQEAAHLMKTRNCGSMVLMSSVQAVGVVPGRIVYSASKAAISAISRGMAYELGKYGIRANSVIAGAIWSERWLAQTEEETARRRSRYPVGRESKPEDIANAVFYLASDQSASVTGTDMVVDSGVSICLLPYDKEWDRI